MAIMPNNQFQGSKTNTNKNIQLFHLIEALIHSFFFVQFILFNSQKCVRPALYRQIDYRTHFSCFFSVFFRPLLVMLFINFNLLFVMDSLNITVNRYMQRIHTTINWKWGKLCVMLYHQTKNLRQLSEACILPKTSDYFFHFSVGALFAVFVWERYALLYMRRVSGLCVAINACFFIPLFTFLTQKKSDRSQDVRQIKRILFVLEEI